jgi:hypothetical protein
MIFVPPSPSKYATTRSLVVAIVIVTGLVVAFVCVLAVAVREMSRPVSEQEKERFWRRLEETHIRKRNAEKMGTANQASQPHAGKSGSG